AVQVRAQPASGQGAPERGAQRLRRAGPRHAGPDARDGRDGDGAAEAGSERRSCIMSRPAHQIIRRPLLTEKGTRLKETGGAPPGTFTEETLKPQVLFEVAADANKIEIKKAI